MSLYSRGAGALVGLTPAGVAAQSLRDRQLEERLAAVESRGLLIVRQTVVQSVGTTLTQLVCDTVDMNTLPGATWTGTFATMGEAGTYLASYDATLSASASTGTFETWIEAEAFGSVGVRRGGGQRTSLGNAPFPKHSGTMLVTLAAGQDIYVNLTQTTGAAKDTDLFIQPRFSLAKIA